MNNGRDDYNILLLGGFIMSTGMWIMMKFVTWGEFTNEGFDGTAEFINTYILNPSALIGYIILIVLWVRRFIKNMKNSRKTKNKKINLNKE